MSCGFEISTIAFPKLLQRTPLNSAIYQPPLLTCDATFLLFFFPLLSNMVLVPYTGTGLFFVWVSRALILLTIFFWGPTTVTPTFFMSLGKKRVRTLSFTAPISANSSKPAPLTLLHCRSLQVQGYCWNTSPGAKNTESNCLKTQVGCKKPEWKLI